MGQNVVEKLLNSFSVLENAINGAIISLTTRPNVPLKILKRIESYTNLLAKQRELVSELSVSVEKCDWYEVSHKIQLINGLLDLIRQDAREIVGELRGEGADYAEGQLIC